MNLQFIASIVFFCLGIVFTIVGFFMKTSVFNQITVLGQKIDALTREVLREYVSKEDCDRIRQNDNQAHKELREEIRKIERG